MVNTTYILYYLYMLQSVALEAAGSGVTCNAICPGFVLTQCELFCDMVTP